MPILERYPPKLQRGIIRIREGNPVDVCYAIVENYYRGSASIQLRIRDMREREDIL